MRPRGLSSSSPSSRYVGQVAVQKPQCTHVRRIFSDDAIAGSRSCSGAKLVCIGSLFQARHPGRAKRDQGSSSGIKLWGRHEVLGSSLPTPPEDDDGTHTPAYIRPGLKMPAGSREALTPALTRMSGSESGS